MNFEEINNKIASFQIVKSEEKKIKQDADILMANFLSEIERVMSVTGDKKKDLAAKIKTSGSYLTQVFRGDKPLNFLTIAKMQKALDIRFRVSVYSTSSSVRICDEAIFFNNIHKYKIGKGAWIWKNINFTDQDHYDLKFKDSPETNKIDENKAISA